MDEVPKSGGKIVDRRELAQLHGVPESMIESWETVPDFPVLETAAGRRFDFLAVLEWRIQQRLKLNFMQSPPGDVLH